MPVPDPICYWGHSPDLDGDGSLAAEPCAPNDYSECSDSCQTTGGDASRLNPAGSLGAPPMPPSIGGNKKPVNLADGIAMAWIHAFGNVAGLSVILGNCNRMKIGGLPANYNSGLGFNWVMNLDVRLIPTGPDTSQPTLRPALKANGTFSKPCPTRAAPSFRRLAVLQRASFSKAKNTNCSTKARPLSSTEEAVDSRKRSLLVEWLPTSFMTTVTFKKSSPSGWTMQTTFTTRCCSTIPVVREVVVERMAALVPAVAELDLVEVARAAA